jgi:hypothetical protein
MYEHKRNNDFQGGIHLNFFELKLVSHFDT